MFGIQLGSRFVKLGEIQSPSKKAILVDGNGNTISYADQIRLDYIFWRHSGRANHAMLDGHVESLRLADHNWERWYPQ